MNDGTPGDRIAALRAEIEHVQRDVADLTGPDAASKEVVSLGSGGVPAEVTRAQLAQVRGRALKQAQRLESLRKQLVAEYEAQARAVRKELDALIVPLREQMARMEEGLWTVNLYLGRDEEIVQLLDGEPAPVESPISLRQQVLSMDEETAAFAETGGIDARNIDVFDEWVKNPAHLAQVFPEPKGVVVLVPRHRGRDYEDPWVNRAMREENAWSYFLIRNGERLYRMRTDFVVGKHLIPTTTEFTGLFSGRRFNPETRTDEVYELTPGTREWDAAAKSQDARQRHFMRMALVLQGLVDRTTVWHPLPPHGVNLLSNDTYAHGTAVLVRDAEHVLTDGRDDFFTWLSKLTDQMRPGMRILGAFNTDEFRHAGGWRAPSSDDGWRGRTSDRVSPNGSEFPATGVIHRLEGRKTLHDVQGFTFKFERVRKSYIDDEYRAPKTRGTCTVLPGDKFVLPYDLVTVEEMRYYLGSRRQRGAYEYMFPLLHAAIAAKEAEAAEEAPFRGLLAGELAKTDPSLTFDEATVVADELVHWWKFTNRYHRALNGDPTHEAQAVRDIVAEHRARRSAASVQSGDEPAEQAMVERLLAEDPSIMVVARKRDGRYLAFAPQPRVYPAGKVGHPATNVAQPRPLTPQEVEAFKAKQHWMFRDRDPEAGRLVFAAVADNVWAVEYVVSKTGRSTKRREWVQPGNRLDRTRVLYSSQMWDEFDMHASANAHLTDVEIDDVISQVVPEVEAYAMAGWPTWRSRAEPVVPLILGVCLRVDGDTPRFEVHLISDELPGPVTAELSPEPWRAEMTAGVVMVPFTKTVRTGVVLHRDDGDGAAPWGLRFRKPRYSTATLDRPWHYYWDGRAQDAIALVTFPGNQAVAVAQAEAIKAHNARVDDLYERARRPVAVVKKAWEARAEKEAYVRFLEEYADPELWESHKETLRGLEANIHPAGRGIPKVLDEALRRFVLDGRSFEGHTVRSVVESCGLFVDGVAEDLLDLPVWEAGE